ncbi:MAG: chorismate-binding protein, partial [Saprospiraceae bacterium]|nr:chorismate-binding protein [Saprospiraceae bacterium]
MTPMTNDPMTPMTPMTSITPMTPMTNDPMTPITNHDIALKALRDCFPMGSMTGAPKIMAMELIERYERSRRGLYSGAVGYFTPDGDFDFNVVIRSILYNAATDYVSAQVGGAIVYDSVPEEEYEECMVKAEAMMRALGS